MRHRGLTLLELLIVVVLIGSMGALIAPFAIGRAKRIAMSDAQQQVEAILTLARADAQRSGTPCRVVAREDREGRVELHASAVPFSLAPLERLSDDDEADGSDAGFTAADPGVAEAPAAHTEAPTGVEASRTAITLPRGVRLTDVLPAAERGRSGREVEPDVGTVPNWDLRGEVSWEAERPADEVVVAVFLPDGGGRTFGRRFLVSEQGQAAEVVINEWTGAVRVQRVPGGEARTEPADVPRERLSDELPPEIDGPLLRTRPR